MVQNKQIEKYEVNDCSTSTSWIWDDNVPYEAHSAYTVVVFNHPLSNKRNVRYFRVILGALFWE